MTVKRAAGLCQILHLHPRLLAEAAPPPSRPSPLHSPQSSPMSRTGAAADSWPLRCSAWVRARLLLGGIRRNTAEPTVFPSPTQHSVSSSEGMLGKYLENITVKGGQVPSLPSAPTCLGPALLPSRACRVGFLVYSNPHSIEDWFHPSFNANMIWWLWE